MSEPAFPESKRDFSTIKTPPMIRTISLALVVYAVAFAAALAMLLAVDRSALATQISIRGFDLR